MTEYSRKLSVTCREGGQVKKCLMEVSDSQWALGFASQWGFVSGSESHAFDQSPGALKGPRFAQRGASIGAGVQR